MDAHLHEDGSFTMTLTEEELHRLDVELDELSRPLPALVDELRRKVGDGVRRARYRRLRP